ncbi:MalY/PatB family protein [Buttiauxella noackiae]|uniref:MalY/PatB family protein n=1 Tax=Buttiauxella noackiae TaxID=82992 RepID=UPI0028D38572|nr:MalY/PatB family protein [Buttiauxella noackiae]
MKNNFDQVINRCATGSVKWDFIDRYQNMQTDNLLPMWVSDYDFACPPNVLEALHRRVDHGVFGYSERDEKYYTALTSWFERRHQLLIRPEWVCSIEGVVPGLSLLVQMLSQVGDSVVVQGPYYGSFAKIIKLNQRNLVENPLQEDPDVGYVMDLAQLEELFSKKRPPLFILCNPHNPTGRCWSKDELTKLLALCEKYDVTVLSDEIWADLLLPGSTFTSVLHLESRWHSRVIAATSASKTFGLSSLRISNFLIPDAELKACFIERLNAHGLDVFNALSMEAATAAYNGAEQWLDELLDYLAANRDWFVLQVENNLPWLRVVPAQGTYLIWIDCRALGLNDDELKNVMTEIAGIAPSMGSGFGPAGSGFIRLNLGCPRSYLEQAIKGLLRIGAQ